MDSSTFEISTMLSMGTVHDGRVEGIDCAMLCHPSNRMLDYRRGVRNSDFNMPEGVHGNRPMLRWNRS